MLKSHIFSGSRRELVVRSKARHVSNGLSCNSTDTIGIRSVQTWSSIHASHEGEAQVPVTEDEGGVDAFERPRIGGSGEMAEATEDMFRMVESDEELAQEVGLVVGKCNVEAVGRSDARAREMHEDLSYEEMMERWEFLKRLPHKLLRDIGSTIAGPSLLSTSRELPTVNPSTLGGSSNQWAGTKAWLEQLSIPAVEAWFASQKSTQRLGDHFALCIEYILRHSPHVEVQHLLTSQQVLQRVTEPVRSSKALKALESKLAAQRGMSDEKPHIALRPCFVDEQQQVSSDRESTSVDESIQLLESMDLCNDKMDPSVGMGGGTPQENVGKRKRKLQKKLERIRLRKGKTNTIGEFDYLFEIPVVQSHWALTEDVSKGKELHHWEVSVKFLLYAGPWEAFGLQSPDSAAWKRDHSSPEMASFEGSIDNGGSTDFRTTTADEYNALNSQGGSREVDAFLGCYLGPHVGETLLDRKARLRNQLALSANPCAALMLRDLYQNKGTAESRDPLNELGTVAELQTVDIAEIAEGEGGEGLTSTTLEDLDGGTSEDSEQLSVVASALLKGYLFYEYKLWGYLESHGLQNTTASPPSMQGRLSRSHWMGWWTRDIMEFGDLPRHQHSKWYIVPKLEWLSPVVIPLWDSDRCSRVLSLSDFVLTAAQVAEEAARLHMPRKRRFLVAEVCRSPDWEPCHEGVTLSACANAASGEELAARGAWLEVSRGFVVEDTWPESKMYRPHGYVVSWSPSLQGRRPDVSGM